MAEPIVVGANESDSAGWNGTGVVTASGNSYVFLGFGTDDGTPAVTAITSSLDGAPDWQNLTEFGGRVYFIAVWYNATVGSHVMSVTETNIGEEHSVMMEITNLATGATAPEDSATNANAATVNADTGTVSPAGDAIIITAHDYDSSGGSWSWDNSEVSLFDGSREKVGYRTITGGGTFDGNGEHGVATNTQSFIAALQGTSTGGGGGGSLPPFGGMINGLGLGLIR